MSRDVALIADSDGFIDIALENGDLVGDGSLETAINISLFTDARVSPSELPDGVQSRRGFWGDMYAEVDGDEIGSKLWTLSRQKQTEEARLNFEDYTRAALRWMIEDKVAEALDVEGSYTDDGALVLAIDILKGTVVYKYQVFWDEQKVKRV